MKMLRRLGLAILSALVFPSSLAAADYSVSTQGSSIVVTDRSGNSDTLFISQPGAGTILFAAAGRTFSVNGGADSNADSGVLSLVGITGVSVDAGSGADIINVGAMTNLPSLTIDGGRGDDEVNLTGDLAFSADANLDVNLQNDTAPANATSDTNYNDVGTDSVTVADNSNVVASGTGTIVVKCSRNVVIASGGSLETADGALIVAANQQATPSTGDFIGVNVNGGLVRAIGNGSVRIYAIGGDGAGGYQIGVNVENGGKILGGTANFFAVYVSGSGGPSTGAANRGVSISGVGSQISSLGAYVEIGGKGGVAGNNRNTGVSVLSGGEISAGGTGRVEVFGGGMGAPASGFNMGVEVAGLGSKISATWGMSLHGSAGAGVPNGSEGSWGIQLSDSASLSLPSDSTSIIQLTTDSLSIDATASVMTIHEWSSVIVAPVSSMDAQTLIDLGGSDSVAPLRTLGISAAELNRISTPTLTIEPGEQGTEISASLQPTNIGEIKFGGYSFIIWSSELFGLRPVVLGADVTLPAGGRIGLFQPLQIAITGTAPDTQVQKLKVVGEVYLSGLLSLASTIPGATGDTFELVENDGTDAIAGTFAGVPEGGFVRWPGDASLVGRISYMGGTGNDVVLTLVALDSSRLVVSSTNSTGPGTLAMALSYANARPGENTITFTTGSETIVFRQEIDVFDTEGVILDASAVDSRVAFAPHWQAEFYARVHVHEGAKLAMKSITVSGFLGSAIYNDGTLSMTRCTLKDNSASFSGGAIYNRGTLALTRCTLSGNSASDGGAISNFGRMTLSHCTLSGNSAWDEGGAIFTGPVYGDYGCQIQNSIVAGNTATNGPDVFLWNHGNITALGVNLIGDNSTVSAIFPTNLPLVGTNGNPANARLAPLANRVGATWTLAPLAGSPARDAALGSTDTHDQRGFPTFGTPDIGAYEAQIGAIAQLSASNGGENRFGFSIGNVGSLSAASSDTAVVPNANILLTGSNTRKTLTISTPPNTGGTTTITITDAFSGETSSFVFAADARDSAPQFNRGPNVHLPYGSGQQTIPNWATGISEPPEESGHSLSFSAVSDRPEFFSSAPVVSMSGTLTFTPAALVSGHSTVTVTLKDTGPNAALNANAYSRTFVIAVHPPDPVHQIKFTKGTAAPGAGTNELPADAVLVRFHSPATSDAGNLAFVADWASATGRLKKGTGLFLDGACLATSGGDASAIGGAGAKWSSFTDPVVDAGRVACIAKLSTGATAVVFNYTGATLEKIALTGESDTTDGAKFESFKNVAVVEGRVAFLAKLANGTGTTPKTTAANDTAIWLTDSADTSTHEVALREGDTSSGKTIKTLVSFLPGNGSPGFGRGTLIRPINTGQPQISALAFFTDKTRGVIARDPDENDFTLISLSGDTATGADTGDAFATYGPPARNSTPTTAFRGKLTVGPGVAKADAEGIFSGPDAMGKFTTLIRTGDHATQAGTTVKFARLKDPVLASDGCIAFASTVTARGLSAQTLWWKPAGQPLALLALLAQGGTRPSPDLPAAVQWKSFRSLAISAGGGPRRRSHTRPRQGRRYRSNRDWRMGDGHHWHSADPVSHGRHHRRKKNGLIRFAQIHRRQHGRHTQHQQQRPSRVARQF